MKLDALDHPKTHALTATLNISRPTAIGHLELLWAFTGKNAPQGNIGKWPNGAIARACDWAGNPDEFVSALIAARLLDLDEVHRVSVHDWHEHAPGWVRAKLKGLNQGFIVPKPPSSGSTAPPSPPGTAQGSPPGSPPGTKPSILGKRSEEKGREEDLLASATPMQLVPRETDQWFLDFKLAYPVRAGDQGWRKAQKAANARRAEGHTPKEFIDGASRYARYCESTGKVGTEYVKQAATFLGPDKPFLNPWTPPVSKSEQRLTGNLSAAEEFMRRTDVA